MKIAFYKGTSRAFNKFTSWWTQGPYSHTEAVFDGFGRIDGYHLCWSSSFIDGGVRPKIIQLVPDKWDIIHAPAIDGLVALDWFHEHKGEGYDLIGLLSTSLPIRHNRAKWICNEAVGAAGGLVDAWRFNPNSFARFVERLPGSCWLQGSMTASLQQMKEKP